MPASNTEMSSAKVLFGRPLKDLLPITANKLRLNLEWHLMLQQQEIALTCRHLRRDTRLKEHTRTLQQLQLGNTVSVQNCCGNNPNSWDLTGTVVKCGDFSKYTIQLDGSGRLTTQNR
jgi:hypothetical protein